MMLLLLIFGLFGALLQGSANKVMGEKENSIDLPSPTWSKRVVGGADTTMRKHPWMVALLRKLRQPRNSPYVLFCGGSLISRQWVLTASPCVTSFLNETDFEYTALLGADTLSTRSPSGVMYQLEFDANKKSPYQPYVDMINNLALIKLKGTVTFNEFIERICLGPPCANYTGQLATITGWGITSDGGKPADVLQELSISILDSDKCKEFGAYYNEATMMCTKNLDDWKKAPCYGDAGSPIIYKDSNRDQIYQIGFHWMGNSECSSNHPLINIDVGKILQGIKSAAKDDPDICYIGSGQILR